MDKKIVYTVFEEQLHIDRLSHRADWRMPYMHYHSAYELLLVSEGGFGIFIDDRVYAAYKYDVFTISPYRTHKNNGGHDHERIAVNFPIEYLEQYFTPAAIRELIECFEEERHTLPAKAFEYILSELMALKRRPGEFYRLCNVLVAIRDSRSEKASISHSSRMGGILEYINRRYNEISGVSQLAGELCISKEHLCRLFRSETGMTVGEYIAGLRIKHACDMLRTTGKRVTEIALAVGYQSPGYFNRVFKKELGISPSQFRKAGS